jgi:hypothetical protein
MDVTGTSSRGRLRRGTIQSLLVAHPARVTQNIFEEDCVAGVA